MGDGNENVGTVTPSFIVDQASGEDHLGQHRRIADAIVEVIAKEEAINVIGLLGSWGSGKSTVVKLVEKGLRLLRTVEREHYIFTYDAWLHQSDPHRRAFIQALVTFLSKKNLTTKGIWDEEIDRLNGKIQDTTITNTPVLTGAGRAIFLSLFLVPIGAVFTGHEWYKDFHNAGWISWPAFVYLISILFVSSPIIVALAIYLMWRPKLSLIDSKFWTTHKSKHKDQSILSIFMNKQVTKSKNRIIRDPDPTAIEFQCLFRKIMDQAAPTGGRARLIFVIDNLDRLPAADALAMWATIRSFFLGAEESSDLPKAESRPTILLPVDETAIASIFNTQDPQAAASFVAKTFDITFRITKPVLSSWDKYLESQMRAVFKTAFNEEWSKLTARFFHYLESSTRDFRVTPRSLNKLVNDIASLWLQWRGDERVSFAAIAYYCVFREQIDSDILVATSSPWSGVDEIDNEWARSIAALHFGVDPKDAEQVLIEQPLRNSVQNDDGEAFNRLATIPGSIHILSRIVSQWRNENLSEPDRVLITARLLKESKIATAQTQYIRRSLRRVLQDTRNWKKFDALQCEGLIALVPDGSLTERKAYLQLVAERLATVDKQTSDRPEFVKAFANFWTDVQSDPDNIEAMPQHISVPGQASNFFNVGSEFLDSNPIKGRLRTQCDPLELVTAISDELNQNVDPRRIIEHFEFIKDTIKNLDLQPFLEHLAQRMRAGQISGPNITATVNLLGRLRSITPNAVALTNALCTEGHINNRLPTAISQKDDQLAAALLALNFCAGIQFEVPDASAWQAALKERPDFVKEISDCLTAFVVDKDKASVAWVLHSAVARSPNLKPIAKAVFSHRVSTNTIGKLPVENILTNFDSYYELIDSELKQTFVVKLSDYNTFWDKMSALPLAGGVATIIKLLIADTSPVGTKARKWAEDALSKINSTEWKTSILSGQAPYDVLRTLGTLTGLPINVEALWDTLNDLIPEVLTNHDSAFRDRWFESAQFLEQEATLTLFRNLCDKLTLGSQVNEIANLLKAGGSRLLKVESFLESADQAVRHVIYPMLDRTDGIAVLTEFAQIFRSWIERSKPETVAQLSTLFFRKVQVDSTQKDAVDQLAISLGIGEIDANDTPIDESTDNV